MTDVIFGLSMKKYVRKRYPCLCFMTSLFFKPVLYLIFVYCSFELLKTDMIHWLFDYFVKNFIFLVLIRHKQVTLCHLSRIIDSNKKCIVFIEIFCFCFCLST